MIEVGYRVIRLLLTADMVSGVARIWRETGQETPNASGMLEIGSDGQLTKNVS